jgi:threonine dehydrogenase-like Zn-dependent dehydrogenase
MSPVVTERMARLMRLLASGPVEPRPMTTHRFGFKDIERAFKMMQTKEDGMIKPLISFT